MGSPEALPRFKCPPDFVASCFAPGPPFSLERLQDPSKELLLIRAPASFSPESFEGQALPLSGSHTVKLPQPNGAQKVFGIHAALGRPSSSARLLVPSSHSQDRLSCAPPFGGSLTIAERHGDPGAYPVLFLAARQAAPQIPEGLKQRFVPFGGQKKRPALGDAAEEPPRKKQKKSKRQLYTPEYMGEPQEEVPAMEENGEESLQELKSSDVLAASQESSLSAEDPSHKRKKKKKKVKEEPTESFLTEADSITHQPQPEVPLDSLTQQPGLALDFEASLEGNGEVGEEKKRKKKKKKEHMEEADSVTHQSQSEMPLDSLTQQSGLALDFEVSLEGNGEVGEEKKKKKKKKKEKELMEEAPMDIKEEPGLEESLEDVAKDSGHKKKKKKKEKMEEETPPELGNGTVLEMASIKDEPNEPANEETSEPNVYIHKKKKKKKAKEEEEEEGTKQTEGTALMESSSLKEEEMQSLEQNMETPSQKHKKKKKKERKKEED
ncbi:DNA-directed RNA polymerase I subunit RPA34-like [Anolis sagrei]|uniref:DNA-directed RNA polymerase I subunit RPA34-like n=1 Tax=Anolis sagrei TaxID=38937 RepID=UPI00352249F1